MRFIMRRLGGLLTPGDGLHLMLLSNEALPFLLSLVIQAGTAYGKDRTTYVEEQYRYHIPKNRDPLAFVPDEQRLLDYIMRGYEKSVRPVRNSSSPVVVQMGLTLTQVLDMDEKNQVLITNVWLDHEWGDEFLVWEPSQFNNITKLRIPCHKIWLPDMVLYNNAAEYTDGLMPANAMVEPNGNVFWPVPTKLQSSCKVDVTYFPFDSQECYLKFGSWTYDGYQVDITNRTSEVDLSNYIVNGEWELVYAKCIRNEVRYACCDEPFPDVTFYVKIRRRTLYYMYNVVFPCVMMSALTLLVFCLPPDSGEKIALGITVLLAFSVFMLAVAENLPETSEFVPLISIYLTIVMALTSVSVIMTVFVLNLHHRAPRKQQVPVWLRKLFLRKQDPKKRSCLHRRDHLHYIGNRPIDNHCLVRNLSLKMTLGNLVQELREELQLDNGASDSDSTPVITVSTPPSSQVEVSVDNGSPSTTSQLLTNSVKSNDVGSVNVTRGRQTNSRPQIHSRGRGSAARSDTMPSRRKHKSRMPYESTLMTLTKLLERHEIEEMEYSDMQDWRQLAQIADRCLFVFFLVATISSTLVVLVVVPTTQDT